MEGVLHIKLRDERKMEELERESILANYIISKRDMDWCVCVCLGRGGGWGVQGFGGDAGRVEEGVEGYGGDIRKGDVKGDGKGFGRGERRLRYQVSQPGQKAKIVKG